MPRVDTISAVELEAFVAVVRAGSFTSAADLLDTRKSHLSRVITRFEARLGARLLQRTTRSLALTEIGREVFERATAILAQMDETVRAVRKTQEAPIGTLRLTCGVEFGLLAVVDWIRAYLMRHSEVRVEADFTNRVVDIVHEGFDLAIRVGMLDDSTLAARKLGSVSYGLFATPSYLRSHGIPKSPSDLKAHSLVLSTQTRNTRSSWSLRRKGERQAIALEPRLLVNTHLAVREAVLGGLGVGLFPTFQGQSFVDRGLLTPVLVGWGSDPTPVHAVFPSSRFLTPSVRAFVDEAVEGFSRLAV